MCSEQERQEIIQAAIKFKCTQCRLSKVAFAKDKRRKEFKYFKKDFLHKCKYNMIEERCMRKKEFGCEGCRPLGI